MSSGCVLPLDIHAMVRDSSTPIGTAAATRRNAACISDTGPPAGTWWTVDHGHSELARLIFNNHTLEEIAVIQEGVSHRLSSTMIEDFEDQDAVRSSGELWTEICSGLPDSRAPAAPQVNTEFRDSFQPAAAAGLQLNGLSHGTLTSAALARWEPMEDSEIYIASLENRLKKIKGQSSDVTSKDMLRSLSQAKKECWDRFLHDAQTSELFQAGDMDESALEHFKRWMIPEKVAISTEELEYLLRPSQNNDQAEPNPTPMAEDTTGEGAEPEEDGAHSPEK